MSDVNTDDLEPKLMAAKVLRHRAAALCVLAEEKDKSAASLEESAAKYRKDADLGRKQADALVNVAAMLEDSQ